MFIRILSVFLALFSVISATSLNYANKETVTVSGYSQAAGTSGSYYQPPVAGQPVIRKMYSAFQNGLFEGVLRVNHQGTNFQRHPRFGHYYLIMSRPGYSKLDVYFQKDGRYRLENGTLGLLERQLGDKNGYISIQVNGRSVVNRHSASSNRRFVESLWDISRYVQDGLNHVEISLDFLGSDYGLLGVKVETREYMNGGGSNNHYQHVQFVNNAFQRIHNRFPTQRELDYYVSLLNSGTSSFEVERLIRNLSNGNIDNDNYSRLVTEYFMTYARRRPTDAELNYYAARLRSNEMTLPQLKAEIERIAAGGNNNSNVNDRIRSLFYEILRRYPTTQELSYYSDRINKSYLTWDQLRNEIIMIGQTGGGGTSGFSMTEVRNMQISTQNLDADFFRRIEFTANDVLRELRRKAVYEEFNTTHPGIKRSCRRIIQTIDARLGSPGIF
jgi:hypothetical protein